MHKTIGERIYAEISKRKLLGAFFDYAGYQQLQRIDSKEELAHFLKSQGHRKIDFTLSEGELVDALLREQDKKTIWQCLFFAPLEFLIIQGISVACKIMKSIQRLIQRFH